MLGKKSRGTGCFSNRPTLLIALMAVGLILIALCWDYLSSGRLYSIISVGKRPDWFPVDRKSPTATLIGSGKPETTSSGGKSVIRWRLTSTSHGDYDYNEKGDYDIAIDSNHNNDYDYDHDNNNNNNDNNNNNEEEDRREDSEFVFVTGASSNHFHSVVLTAYQVRLLLPDIPIVVWDFGLTSDEVELIGRWRRTDYRRFPFEDYPEWMNIQTNHRGHYAWKPVAIYKTANELTGDSSNRNRKQSRSLVLLWLDGDIVVTGLKEIYHQLEAQGFFTLQSQGTISKWVHRGTLSALGADRKSMADLPNASGGVCAFDIGQRDIMRLLERWKDCALQPDCIAPRGSSRDNHRQDQSVLTVLMHQFHLQPSPKSVCDIETHTSTNLPIKDMLDYLETSGDQ